MKYTLILFLALLVPRLSFCQVSESAVEMYVDEEPQFPGGTAELNKFLHDNFNYPQSVFENGFQGKVYISFLVSKSGKISDMKVWKGAKECTECDIEAVRIVSIMPNWTPAKKNGEIVSFRHTIVIFIHIE